MKRSQAIILAALLAVTLGGGIYLTRAGHVPPGQPPLVEVNSSTLTALQKEFNRTAGTFRIILLLSPT